MGVESTDVAPTAAQFFEVAKKRMLKEDDDNCQVATVFMLMAIYQKLVEMDHDSPTNDPT